MPALPLDEAGRYVAAAYIVFVGLILVYVAIMATKIQRINQELDDLTDLAERNTKRPAGASDEVAGPESGSAARLASQPADTGGGAEDVGGGVQARASGEVAGRASGSAAPTASQPAGTGAEGEDSGGGVHHG